MKNILLFPGAFNPPHNGHALIAEIVVNKITFDEIWIMPSGKREDKTILTSYEDRRNLGSLFVEYLQTKFTIPVKLITNELDDIEGRYTHEILKEIKSQAGFQVTQLIGLDGFLTLKDKLTDKNERFIVIDRSGYSRPKDLICGENITVIENNTTQNISSTQIREMVHNRNMEYKKLVPEEIANYIEKNNLYL